MGVTVGRLAGAETGFMETVGGFPGAALGFMGRGAGLFPGATEGGTTGKLGVGGRGTGPDPCLASAGGIGGSGAGVTRGNGLPAGQAPPGPVPNGPGPPLRIGSKPVVPWNLTTSPMTQFIRRDSSARMRSASQGDRTTCGVRIISSSRLFLISWRYRKAAPISGKSPSTGILFSILVSLLLIKPPRATVSPSWHSTVVSRC